MSKIVKKASGKVVGRVAGKMGKEILVNLNPLEVLHEYFDYKKKVQENKSWREEINAKRDIAIRTLEYQKEIIITYFEKRFEERKVALESFFNLLSFAITSKDDKQLDVALAGIMGIIKENPLGDFKQFKENMLKDGFTIEL